MKFGKYVLASLLIILSNFTPAFAQLLNYPESVVYDSSHSRYLVSSWDTGNMVQIDSSGNQDYFVTGQYCCAGLHIAGGVVYVAGRSQGVRGFDLETGERVLEALVPGSVALNDVTSDDMGNLYVTDVNTNRIYKINMTTGDWSIFVSSSISSPNGIYFDEAHNRLLLVSSRNFSPIQAIDLSDSSVTTVVYTGLSILDGLTMDEQGNVYFSSWNTHSVYKYDSTFTNPPELVSTHSPEPADIYYNHFNHSLAVPVFYGNYIDFVQLPSTSVETVVLPNYHELSAFNYPNPFNESTVIEYEISSPSIVCIRLFDALGRKIEILQKYYLQAGTYRIGWNAAGLPSGIYFYRIETGNGSVTGRMILLK